MTTAGTPGTPPRLPRGVALGGAAVLAAVVVWAATGWRGLPPFAAVAAAMAAAVLLRLVRPILPRPLRVRAGGSAVVAGLGVLSLWSSPGALWVGVGATGAGLALTYPRGRADRARLVVAIAAVGAAAIGGIGLLLEHVEGRAARAAAHIAAGDDARAQMLPDTPTEALSERPG